MKKTGATIIIAALLAVLLAAGCKGGDEPDETAAERYVVMGGRLVLYSGNAADVIVPDGTASIGNNAFKGCARLEKVFIPASVTYIAGGAFRGVDIGYMAYGDTVARWEEVVAGSSGLAASLAGLSVVCTDGVWNAPTDPGDEPGTPGIWQITDGVLTAYTGSGTHVTVPAGVTTIAEGAFAGTGVTAADLPASVTRIEPGAFADGTVLTYHGTREEWERLLENGDLTGLTVFAVDDDGVLVGYSGNETHVTIPGSVTAIGEGAFKGCTGLTDVTVPGSVTDIGEGAFEGCDSLTNVTFGGTREQLEELVGGSGIDLSKVTVTISDEASVWDIRDGVLLGYYGSETDIVIPDDVTAIGEGAFAGNTSLTSVTIPDGVTGIGGGAFGGSGITDISYGGTMAEWDALVKAGGIADEVADITVTCADGTWTPEHRHTWGEGYTDGGDGTHYQTCTECGKESAPEEHDCDVVYEADGHHKTCTACDYAEVEEHDYDGAPYVDDGNGRHYQTCTATGCGGQSEAEEHDCEYEDNGDGTHTATCTKCAYSQSAEEHRYEDGTCVDCTCPQPTTVYVASTGSDTTGNGSRTKPFATIQKALDTVIAWNDGTSEYTIYIDGTLTQSAAPSDGKDGMADFSDLSESLTLTIKALSGTATLDAGGKSRVINASPSGGTLKLTLENLVITGGKAAVDGGGIFVANGTTLTMNGTITGNTAQQGGGVYVTGDTGVFTMTGGEISDNHTTTDSANGNENGISGGGIFIYNGAKADISGTTISNNTSNNNGGGIHVNGGTLTIGSGTIISGNNAEKYGGGVYVNDIFNMDGGTISGNTAQQDGGGVYVTGGTFTMTGGIISGNTAEGDNGGGICLSGGAFTMDGSTSIISGNKSSFGGGVQINNDGTFTMKNGTISENEAIGNGTVGGGGGVHVYKGAFNMSGGTISKNKCLVNTEGSGGGGVYVYTGQKFTMSGGTISGNTAAKDGGGVYSNNGDFTMTGGTIGGTTSDKNTAQYGGGVYLMAGANTFTMSGGEISGNKANEQGGGVYVNNTNFSMSGTAKVNGNTATDSGGGICVYKNTANAVFTMAGGEISGNTATTGNGGGIYNQDGDATIHSGKISKNRATSVTNGNGGGVYNASGTFTMYGGTIGGDTTSDKNTAQSGGGVCVKYGTFTMYDGNIINNNGSYDGGGVHVDGNSTNKFGTFTMKGGIFSGNSAKYGKGAYLYNCGMLEMSDDANFNKDDNVYIYSSSSKILIAGTLNKDYVATITLPASAYVAGTQVLSGTVTDDICKKFLVTQQADGTKWKIVPNGSTAGVLKKDEVSTGGGISVTIPGVGSYTFKFEEGSNEIVEGSKLSFGTSIKFSEVKDSSGKVLTSSDGDFSIEIRDEGENTLTSATGFQCAVAVPAVPPIGMKLQIYAKVVLKSGIVIDKKIAVTGP